MTQTVRAAPLTKTVARSWGLFLALAFLMLGNGLLGTLLGIRSEREGFGTVTIGIVFAMYYVGFLVGSQWIPTVLDRVGHVRAFAGLASLASIAALIHSIAVNPAAWGSMRLVTGLCQAGLYVVAESWLNELATNKNRGRLLSMYMTVLMGGLVVGQFFVTFADPGGFVLFILASAMVSLAVVPISLSVGTAPRFDLPERLPFLAVWKASPLAMVGGLGTGMSNGGFMSIAAVYATRSGMSTSGLATFIAVALTGALLLQWPLGAASDRFHRSRVILLATMGAAAVAALATFLDPTSGLILLAALAFGGLSFPTYSLCLSLVNDQLPEGQRVAASSVYVFTTGLGAVLGPITLSLAMLAVGEDGFWWTLVGVHVFVAVFAMYRIRVKRPIPVGQQSPFALSPPRASAVVARLASRTWRTISNGADRVRPGRGKEYR